MPAFAIAGLVLLAALAVFQIALAAGAPLGRFAWGGRHDVLPPKRRVGSAVVVAIYAVFALFLLSEADLISVVGEPQLTIGMWAILVCLALTGLLNLFSRSRFERTVMTPAALAPSVSFSLVTLSA
ncbi:hypothetical protein K3N28_17825 [Glycomyces sp. TRM65418]|uniref:hypothetical protein n=1 Tax=Glycomyces sp. TRM65418 TaxID=2867006 RepID=UPI001CE664F5|nr:hypothetical protein [Glycomyces sp. TRM65418]MCC3764920.1 hypothetical protein [Glycomyces sp. TRM65418]QZD54561.1 hypothetical protein K3N28_17735 [Glycomyces sp. TRM65418]